MQQCIQPKNNALVLIRRARRPSRRGAAKDRIPAHHAPVPPREQAHPRICKAIHGKRCRTVRRPHANVRAERRRDVRGDEAHPGFNPHAGSIEATNRHGYEASAEGDETPSGAEDRPATRVAQRLVEVLVLFSVRLEPEVDDVLEVGVFDDNFLVDVFVSHRRRVVFIQPCFDCLILVRNPVLYNRRVLHHTVRDRTKEGVRGLWGRMNSVVNCSIVACRTKIVEVSGEHFTRGDADNN